MSSGRGSPNSGQALNVLLLSGATADNYDPRSGSMPVSSGTSVAGSRSGSGFLEIFNGVATGSCSVSLWSYDPDQTLWVMDGSLGIKSVNSVNTVFPVSIPNQLMYAHATNFAATGTVSVRLRTAY